MANAGIFLFRENSHGSDGNRTAVLMISSQRLWALDHEAGHFRMLAVCFVATGLTKSMKCFAETFRVIIEHKAAVTMRQTLFIILHCRSFYSTCTQRYVCLSVCLKANKCKVKCTLVQALSLFTGRMAHRGVEIKLYFSWPLHQKWWEVSVTHWPHFILGKDPVPIVQKAGGPEETVWTSA
jgi:hypothetical protein